MNLKAYRSNLLHTLDIRRAREKVAVHYGGEARRILSINRGCIWAEDAEQIGKIIASLEDGTLTAGAEVVGIQNRFAHPSPTGYRDLKALIRDPANRFISMMRVVATPFEKVATEASAPFTWAIWAERARSTLAEQGEGPPIVLVADNYLKDDEDSLTAVFGFSGAETAWQYAVSRFKDSLRVLQPNAVSTQDLKSSWTVFGEDIGLLVDEDLHHLGADLLAYILELSVPDKAYWEMEEEESLRKLAVLPHSPSS